MDIIARNLFVLMQRDNLSGIQDRSLSARFAFKWYEPGDQQKWIDIHQLAERYAEVSAEVYQHVFAGDVEALRQRQCFLLDPQQVPIATATAWFEKGFRGHYYGRLHWVAVIPEYQGRGLSKPLLSIVLNRMIELGHDRAYLRTSTARLPAIELYQQFGFEPLILAAEDRDLWQQVNDKLRRPFELREDPSHPGPPSTWAL